MMCTGDCSVSSATDSALVSRERALQDPLVRAPFFWRRRTREHEKNSVAGASLSVVSPTDPKE